MTERQWTQEEVDLVAGKLGQAIVALCEAEGSGADPAAVFLAAFDSREREAGASSAPDYPAEQETADESWSDLMANEL